MFRLALLSFFLVAANADLFGRNDMDALRANVERQLQDFDFAFNFAGIEITPEVAQELCPTEWQGTLGCVLSECPQFLDVCPEFEVPAENVGTLRKLSFLHVVYYYFYRISDAFYS